jgi:hypothetical protein
MIDPVSLEILIKVLSTVGSAGLAATINAMTRGTSSVQSKEVRKIATTVLFKEWDDRLGPSRLWLARRNPDWVKKGAGRTHMKFDTEGSVADDAESGHHANRILNFIEDVAIAEDALDEELLTDLMPSLDLWYVRCEPVRQRVDGDKALGTLGWKKADALIEIWKKRKAPSPSRSE